jgi:protein-S-isoprenylcysteine O-methyltransferase Ste14
MEKLTIFGIGPKIGRIALPWLAVAIVLSIVYPDVFAWWRPQSLVLLIPGIILMALGVALWFASGKQMVQAVKETKLLTKGPFGLCRNPLYSAIILFVVPGLSLVMNSWLILTTCPVAYLVFRQCIKEECIQLEKIFGDEYKKYCSETPEFFPVNIKKWFGK